MIDLDKTRQVVKSVSDRVKRDTMSVCNSMDVIQHAMDLYEKEIHDLRQQLNAANVVIDRAAKNDMKCTAGTLIAPPAGDVYDSGDELDQDGRYHPYIIPFKGAYRYTRSRFEFLKECSFILHRDGCGNAPIKEQVSCLIEAGVPFECLAHVIRHSIKDALLLTDRADSEIYPYLRSAWCTLFRNDTAEWSYAHEIAERDRQESIRRTFNSLKEVEPKHHVVSKSGRAEASPPVAEKDKEVVTARIKKSRGRNAKDMTPEVEALFKTHVITNAPYSSIKSFKALVDGDGVNVTKWMAKLGLPGYALGNSLQKGIVAPALNAALLEYFGQQIFVKGIIGVGRHGFEKCDKLTKDGLISLIKDNHIKSLEALDNYMRANSTPLVALHDLSPVYRAIVNTRINKKITNQLRRRVNSLLGFGFCKIDESLDMVNKDGTPKQTGLHKRRGGATRVKVVYTKEQIIGYAIDAPDTTPAAFRQYIVDKGLSKQGFNNAYASFAAFLNNPLTGALACRKNAYDINEWLGEKLFKDNSGIIPDTAPTQGVHTGAKAQRGPSVRTREVSRSDLSYEVLRDKVFNSLDEFGQFLRDNNLSVAYMAEKVGISRQAGHKAMAHAGGKLTKWLLDNYNCKLNW